MGYVMLSGCHSWSPSDHEQFSGHFGLASSAGLVVNQSRERVR